MTCVVGLDVGTVRVGLAASDPSRQVAFPVATLERRNARLFWEQLEKEMKSRDATAVVVGLPLHLDGSEGQAARDCRAFGQKIAERTALPVDYWDERLTTVQAEQSLLAVGMRRQPRRQRVDAVAATMMLQSWLDAARVREART